MRYAVALLFGVGLCAASALAQRVADRGNASEFETPIRLEADGKPIDIAKISRSAHAGPWIADIDGDGDRDLLVGDFPGYFWLFDNVGNDKKPVYAHRGKLQAGATDAKTPVY